MGAINGKNMNIDGTMLFFCCQGNIDGGFSTQGITNKPVMCTSAEVASMKIHENHFSGSQISEKTENRPEKK